MTRSTLARPLDFSVARRYAAKHGGFTLVEVALALGVIGFCLVSLFGLLPIGLDTLRAANNEAAATNCLEQIAASIRNANLQPASTTKFAAAAPYQATLTWDLGGSKDMGFGGNVATLPPLPYLSAGAFPDTNAAEQRFVAYVRMTPPKDTSKKGTALISVAWPVQASWDETSANWKNAQGSVLTQVIFLSNS